MRPLWRDLILGVWGSDPLKCPCCEGTMRRHDESGGDTPELWDQSTGTAWKAPEIDLGDGRTLVLEYT